MVRKKWLLMNQMNQQESTSTSCCDALSVPDIILMEVTP